MATLAPWVAWLALAGAFWLAASAALLVAYLGTLRRLWREPVFHTPTLVLESDDWGAGQLIQATALRRLSDLLQQHRDGQGHPATLTLALVLAVPDPQASRRTGAWQRIELDAPFFAPVRQALLEGERRGVFALQLHGHEHLWPAAVQASADPSVRAWLESAPPAMTEALPSALQSRWVDARTLPSRALTAEVIGTAVRDEVAAFSRIVGRAPDVVVPPTFVWTEAVEDAWAREGVRRVVTPGVRYTERGPTGESQGEQGPFFNGQRRDGLVYSVRTDYFEPKKGRDARYALAALARDVHLGRPCVLENHRDNFCSDEALRQRSEHELNLLLSGAVQQQPGLRFLSTPELFDALQQQDPAFIVRGVRRRLPFFWRRVAAESRLWKLMRALGLAALGDALVRRLAVPVASGQAAA